MNLYLNELMSKNEFLDELLTRSKKNREEFAKKNAKYVNQSKIDRMNNIEKKYPSIKLKMGQKIFPVLVKATENGLKKDGLEIIKVNDYKKINDGKTIIFAPTHIGKYDIEATYVLTNTHSKLLSGTEDRMHGTMNGIFLGLAQAVNYVDRFDTNDRNISLKYIDRDLKHGCNVQWFVEGTWNISPNSLFYDISYSMIHEAIINDAAIETVAYVQEGKKLFANFGGRFDLSPYKNDVLELSKRIDYIKKEHANEDEYKSVLSDLYMKRKSILIKAAQVYRDFMATLKYETIEAKEKYLNNNNKDGYYYTKRSSLYDNEGARILYDAIVEWPITDLIEENNCVRKIKDDAHEYFDTFNSREYYENGKKKVERISSEGVNRQYSLKK